MGLFLCRQSSSLRLERWGGQKKESHDTQFLAKVSIHFLMYTLLPKIASHMPELPPLEACCDGCYTLTARHTVEAYPVSLGDLGEVLPASKKTLCGACCVGHDFPVKRYSNGFFDYAFGTVVEYSEDEAAPFRMSFLDSEDDIWLSLPRKPTLAYLAHANSFNRPAYEKDERAFHPSLLDSSESGDNDEVNELDQFPLFNDDRIIDLNDAELLPEEEPSVNHAVPRKDVNKSERSSTRTRSSSRKKNQASLVSSKSQASARAQPKKNGRTKRRSGGGRKIRCPVLWTDEEDVCLKQAVAKCAEAGSVRWPDVAQLPGLLGRRTGKQCRERFINHLCPSLKKKDEWSPHEDFSIVSLLFRLGTKWSVITPFIPGRTDNGIKNRFHNLRRRHEKVAETKCQQYEHTDLLVPSDEENSDDETDLVVSMKAKVRKLSRVIALESGGPLPPKSKDFPFGPFLACVKEQKQCKRCHLFLPSAQTGIHICKSTGWCSACTLIPLYVVHDQLRRCLNMRQLDA